MRHLIGTWYVAECNIDQSMPLESVVTSGVVQLPVDLNNHTIKNVLMMKINDHESQF